MKKFVVLTAVLLVTALGITACAVPSMGKLEIVGTSEPAEAAARGSGKRRPVRSGGSPGRGAFRRSDFHA